MEDGDEQCHLLKGGFAYLVQVFLAVMCVGTLVVKRQTESPRREWIIWFLDAMKQGIGATIGHFGNIMLSLLIARGEATGDECQWYCLSYLLDATFGLFFNIVFLSCFEACIRQRADYGFLRFGNYGRPPRASSFIAQLVVWLLIVAAGKAITVVLQVMFSGHLNAMLNDTFYLVRSNPKIELILVMIVIPVIVNGIQFWLTDSYLKQDEHSDHRGTHQALRQTDDDDDDDELGIPKEPPLRASLIEMTKRIGGGKRSGRASAVRQALLDEHKSPEEIQAEKERAREISKKINYWQVAPKWRDWKTKVFDNHQQILQAEKQNDDDSVVPLNQKYDSRSSSDDLSRDGVIDSPRHPNSAGVNGAVNGGTHNGSQNADVFRGDESHRRQGNMEIMMDGRNGHGSAGNGLSSSIREGARSRASSPQRYASSV